MNTQYFRITAYLPVDNLSIIIDSNGMYEKLWQFSSNLIQKGFTILEVSNDEKFLDVNISKTKPDTNKLILRASASGKPENISNLINGVMYQAVKVDGRIYIPDKDKKI